MQETVIEMAGYTDQQRNVIVGSLLAVSQFLATAMLAADLENNPAMLEDATIAHNSLDNAMLQLSQYAIIRIKER